MQRIEKKYQKYEEENVFWTSANDEKSFVSSASVWVCIECVHDGKVKKRERKQRGYDMTKIDK